MKKLSIFFIFFSIFSLVFAHSLDIDLQKEIEKGKNLVEKFQKGEIKCQDLTNDDFHSIGEYVMDLMVGGDDHLRMNQMMHNMHGEEGEELMHISMGKNFLGCDSQNSHGDFSWLINNQKPQAKTTAYFENWPERPNPRLDFFQILGFVYLVLILITFVLVIVLLILAIIYLFKKIRKNG